MTTPVQASQSEKIAMTTPVTVTGESSFTVAFIMPAEYTLETLPQPKDNRVHFTPIPARSMAAIRFSGYFRQDTIQKNKQRLSHWLEEQGLETEGDFIVAGYNPPWVPGFLARNEVLIQIKTETSGEKMIRYLKLYLVSLAAFLAIDMLWLGLVARSFYQQYLGFLMAPSPNWFAADHFLSALHRGNFVLCGCSRAGKRLTQNHPPAGGLVWADHLCHLRPDQPRHLERLARAGHRGGYALGNGLERFGKLYQFYGRQATCLMR